MTPPTHQPPLLPSATPDAPWLLVAAAPAEARAIAAGLHTAPPDPTHAPLWTPIPASPRFDLLLTGVGKANAAAATARALDPARHAGVISIGVAGSLPTAKPLPIASAIAATQSRYDDEGLETPEGPVSIDAIGFPPDPLRPELGVACPSAAHLLAEPHALTTDVIATVSACAAADPLAHRRAQSAIAEAMEGAAVGFTAHRLAPGTPFLELRVISNTTGDRDTQTWDLPRALAALTDLAHAL